MYEIKDDIDLMCIEDLFIPNTFDDESRIDILVDTKRRLMDDQESFKCTVSTNLNSNKYIEEAKLDLSIFEPTDLQKLVYEATLKEINNKESDEYYLFTINGYYYR